MSRISTSLVAGLVAGLSILALTSAAAAQQGYQYTSVDGSQGQTLTSVMSVWGQNISMKMNQGETFMGSMSFDGDVLIASDGVQYFEITRAMAEQMAQAMAGVGGMMAQAMADAQENMSAEELEQLKKMGIPGFGGADEPVEESRRVSSGEKDSTPLGSCTLYRYEFPDGTPDQELCEADEKVIGFDESRAAFEGLAEFFESFTDAMSAGPLAGMQKNPFARMDDFMPIKGKQYLNGELISEWMLTDARRADLGPDDFGPPPGLPKAEMPIGQ